MEKDIVLYVLGLFCRSVWKGQLYLPPESVILEADSNILHSPVIPLTNTAFPAALPEGYAPLMQYEHQNPN